MKEEAPPEPRDKSGSGFTSAAGQTQSNPGSLTSNTIDEVLSEQ